MVHPSWRPSHEWGKMCRFTKAYETCGGGKHIFHRLFGPPDKRCLCACVGFFASSCLPRVECLHDCHGDLMDSCIHTSPMQHVSRTSLVSFDVSASRDSAQFSTLRFTAAQSSLFQSSVLYFCTVPRLSNPSKSTKVQFNSVQPVLVQVYPDLASPAESILTQVTTHHTSPVKHKY